MRAKTWPPIRKSVNHGKPTYIVDARYAGQGERKFFPTKTEAEGWAQVQRVRRQNEGNSGFDDTRLTKHGWTVQQAIRFAVEHLERQAASIPVPEAIDRLISSKAAAGRRADYCSDLRRRLTRFADFAKGKTLAQFTAPDIEEFLSSLNVAEGTWNTYRRDLVTLWSYGTKAGIVASNEAMKSERATEIDKPPGILTPVQAAAMLAASADEDVLALHAIGLFAGLRVSELGKLDWNDVDLAGGYIHIAGANSKTRSRRLVPILENLHTWLEPMAKRAGKIQQPNFRRRSAAARNTAGIIPWPANALRHTFVSYRLADTGNAAQTALESGHDQSVLFAHYRELVKPKDAKKFFSIRPAKTGKVVSIYQAVA